MQFLGKFIAPVWPPNSFLVYKAVGTFIVCVTQVCVCRKYFLTLLLTLLWHALHGCVCAVLVSDVLSCQGVWVAQTPRTIPKALPTPPRAGSGAFLHRFTGKAQVGSVFSSALIAERHNCRALWSKSQFAISPPLSVQLDCFFFPSALFACQRTCSDVSITATLRPVYLTRPKYQALFVVVSQTVLRVYNCA